MRYYFLIIIWLVVGAGCATSTKSNPQPLAASPKDVNSSGEAAFNEFEDDLSQRQVTIADPFESLNRTMYGFNDVLYFWVAKPVTQIYKAVLPKPVRIGIGNFFHNLTTPARFVNCLLQGKNQAAGRELHRFVLNTTAGVLGFGDPAHDRWALKPAEEDLGQSLAVYSLGDGFYVVLPLFGPSTLRDSVGMVGDQFLNPVRYVKPVEASIGISVVSAVNNGSFHIGEYETFKSAAVDPYVAMRNAYIQYRKNQIRAEDQPLDPNVTVPEKKTMTTVTVEKNLFGTTSQGRKVDLYTLTNANGMKVGIMNYGAAVTSIVVPDRKGNFADIVPGYDTFDGYLKANPYFGGIVGRFGNRIARGKFTLDAVQYSLATNNNVNHLHGGNKGFDKVLWKAKSFKRRDAAGVKLSYLSKDGEEGYPGNLNVTVTYTLTSSNELKLDYAATTDKATPVNLTQHGYYNLAGQGNGDILAHLMMINADRFTPIDDTLIPTGQLLPVKGTPMDFTMPTAIGARINDADDQLRFGKGYDHNWVLNKTDNSMTLACHVYEPTSGRVMEIYTTEPGLQFYSGNFLDGTIIGKSGKVYGFRSEFVLESQHFPDSPNQPNFPSTILRKGKYDSHTIYRFSAK